MAFEQAAGALRSPFLTARQPWWDRLFGLGLTAVILLEVALRPSASVVYEAPLALVLTLSLVLRRRYPDGVLWTQFLAGYLLVRTSHLAPLEAIAYVAMTAAGYSAGAHSSRRRFSLASVLAISVFATIGPIGAPLELSTGSTIGLPVLAAWLIGATVRGYRERAQQRDRERASATRTAAAEERARIARELHDVVAHSVSMMVVQAEAARTLVGRDPEATLKSLRSISATGREAMVELRHILGVLHQPDRDAPPGPQPDLEQLDSLIGRVREAGLPVEYTVQGSPHPLAPGLALTAYRIVQEALTNAVKHAGGARTAVVVRYEPQDLLLEVVDEGAAGRQPDQPGTGRGLVGMHERVAAYGGELEAGPLPGRGYAVRARLPLTG